MYSSHKVENYLQSCKFSGEADKATLQCSFYITPVSYDLLYEVDERVAKQLFRREGTNHLPVSELGKTVLNLGELGIHNLELYPHSDEGADGAGQMVPGCRITEVFCDKLFADKPDWSLIWKVVLPLDAHSLDLVRKYYKKTAFITLVEAQQELFDTDDKKPIILSDAEVESGKEIFCGVCDAKAEYLGMDQSAWCGPHVNGAVGIQVRKIRYYQRAVTTGFERLALPPASQDPCT